MLFIIYVLDDELCLVTGGASQKISQWTCSLLTRRGTESHAKTSSMRVPVLAMAQRVRVEFLNLLTRRRTESLEDLRHVLNATRQRA